jgi:transcriptional repressor NrdR
VESDLWSKLREEVESRELGEMVLQRLRGLDEVAYVRFASVYREFKNLRDFVDELMPMLADTQRPR